MANWRVMTTVTTGGPLSQDLILPSQAAARARAAVERGLPGVSLVTVHRCPHAAGEPASEWYNCKDAPQAQYEVF